MKTIPKRLFIYSRDIENITGRSQRTAQTIMQKMRIYFKKQKGDYITIKEFCYFMGLNEEWVRENLFD